jgi:lactose/L-arabinose transport system substrate-binding protein
MGSRISRRTFLKQAALLGAATAATTALAACSTPQAAPTVVAVQTQAAKAGGEAAAPAGAPVLACNGLPLGSPTLKASLEVWSWATEALSVVTPTFNKLYPNVDVKYVNLPHDQTHDKAAVAIAAGTGAPDVFSIDGAFLQKFIKAGGLLDVTETFKSCTKDFPAYKVAEASDTSGKLFALPWDMGPMGLFYRKSMLEEKKFAVPTTWDEYIQQGIEFAKDKHYMVEMPKSGSNYYFDTLLQQLGGSYFAPDGSVVVDNPLGIQAMTMVKKMYDAGITADIAQWTPGWYSGWKEGTLLTNWGAAWMGHVFPDNIKESDPTYGDWRIAPLPAFEKGGATSSNAGGSNLAVPAQTKQREAAVDFCTYAVASTEGQVLGTLAGNISAFLPAMRDPRVANATNPIYGDEKYFALFADLAGQVPTKFLRTAAYNESTAVLSDTTAKVMSGALPVDQAMKQAGDAVRAIAAKYV